MRHFKTTKNESYEPTRIMNNDFVRQKVLTFAILINILRIPYALKLINVS